MNWFSSNVKPQTWLRFFTWSGRWHKITCFNMWFLLSQSYEALFLTLLDTSQPNFSLKQAWKCTCKYVTLSCDVVLSTRSRNFILISSFLFQLLMPPQFCSACLRTRVASTPRGWVRSSVAPCTREDRRRTCGVATTFHLMTFR